MNESEKKHSPVPWHGVKTEADCSVCAKHGYTGFKVVGADDSVVWEDNAHDSCPPEGANADFVLKACNYHDKLVEALREMTNALRLGIAVQPNSFLADNAIALLASLESERSKA